MTLENQTSLRKVKGLEESDLMLIRAFLQGAVYCWVKNRKYEEFAVRDLVGGENTNWGGTPLQVIYKKHIDAGKSDDDAYDAAAKDVGRILKEVLSDDSRCFKVGTSGLTNAYRWVK